MERLIVRGGKPLEGTVHIHGAKNSILPILAACVLCPERCVITRCPDILDASAAVEILHHIGCTAERIGSSVVVDATTATGTTIPPDLMGKMRASVNFLGALLGRFGQGTLSMPGGCCLGDRPIDYHIQALKQLGVELREEGRSLCFSWPKRHGGEITLPFPSVGATENVVMAAVSVPEPVILHNAAREPEVVDLCSFLCAMGAKISGIGTDTLCIHGETRLRGTAYAVLPDRIETATYLSMAAACGGKLHLKNARWDLLKPVVNVLREAGCQIDTDPHQIVIESPSVLTANFQVQTDTYPGFPTDAQAPVMAAMLRGEGECRFCETVFQNRFCHVEQLRKFGADISVDGCCATVRGVANLHPAHAFATDLRGGAGALIAALQTPGESIIENAHLVRRGYADLVQNLQTLGVDIFRETTETA